MPVVELIHVQKYEILAKLQVCLLIDGKATTRYKKMDLIRN
jgi:hypothetical protein